MRIAKDEMADFFTHNPALKNRQIIFLEGKSLGLEDREYAKEYLIRALLLEEVNNVSLESEDHFTFEGTVVVCPEENKFDGPLTDNSLNKSVRLRE